MCDVSLCNRCGRFIGGCDSCCLCINCYTKKRRCDVCDKCIVGCYSGSAKCYVCKKILCYDCHEDSGDICNDCNYGPNYLTTDNLRSGCDDNYSNSNDSNDECDSDFDTVICHGCNDRQFAGECTDRLCGKCCSNTMCERHKSKK